MKLTSPPRAEEPRKRGGQFPGTSWTLLEAANQPGESGKAARDEFVARYYPPARAYIAAIVRDGDQADDLVQAFIERVVLKGRLLSNADRRKGGFRSFLKQSLRNFVIDHMRKKGVAGPQVHPDGATGGWDRVLDEHPASAESEYHTAFVRALLEAALQQVRARCEERGQLEHFQLFVSRYLPQVGSGASWRELGQEVGLDERTARNRAETVARHFRLTLREMLAADMGSVDPQAVDEELTALLSFL